MAVDTDDVIVHRRELVARFRAQRMSVREIARCMADPGRCKPVCVNPDSGEAWSHAIIAKDLKAIRQTWLKNTRATAERHRADLIAELDEAEHIAFIQGDVPGVVACIRQKAALLGVNDEPDPGRGSGALIIQFTAATPPELVPNADDSPSPASEAAQLCSGD